MKTINEGRAVISIYEGELSRKLPVFYNQRMKLNRDLSVLLLKTIKKKSLRIADPLAASGIRSIRFLKELPISKIEKIYINDIKKSFPEHLKLNLKLSKIQVSKKSKIKIFNKDANIFLLTEKVFDYIDIDPFGTPNTFLDSSIKKLANKGILAVTATDTSALCGTYENACKRKYWARPQRSYMMHEIGLRILIRKVQLVAAQYEKALIPVLSYAKEHYMRVFFECKKGKTRVDKILAKHKLFEKAGPMWVGGLLDLVLIKNMIQNSKDDQTTKFLYLLKSEEETGAIGFYDTHALAKKYKLQVLPRKKDLIFILNKKGYKASETHFSGSGIKTDMPLSKLMVLLKGQKKKIKEKIKK